MSCASSGSCDSMNLVIVELMGLSGCLSLRKISFWLSHSAMKRSDEDESRCAQFNIVVRRDRLYLLYMALVMEKKAFICCFHRLQTTTTLYTNCFPYD